MTTLIERLQDRSKVQLSTDFIDWLHAVAYCNNRTPNSVWLLWQQYAEDCSAYDQSPVGYEFLSWHHLNEP